MRVRVHFQFLHDFDLRPLVAPVLAKQMLHIIRNLYFISSRHGSNMLTQHTFVYLTAIDILSAYPRHVDSFTREIRPTSPGKIPSDPLERNLDLFFLNTVEHFTFVLPPEMNEDLLMAATTPYLATGENTNLLEIFEAAHSVTLAVFSAPQNAQIAASHVPFYVDTLFKVNSVPPYSSQNWIRILTRHAPHRSSLRACRSVNFAWLSRRSCGSQHLHLFSQHRILTSPKYCSSLSITASAIPLCCLAPRPTRPLMLRYRRRR